MFCPMYRCNSVSESVYHLPPFPWMLREELMGFRYQVVEIQSLPRKLSKIATVSFQYQRLLLYLFSVKVAAVSFQCQNCCYICFLICSREFRLLIWTCARGNFKITQKLHARMHALTMEKKNAGMEFQGIVINNRTVCV